MKVRFFILPPPKLNKFVFGHSKRARDKHKTYFVVDNKKLFPHITLCKISIEKRKLGKLYESIESTTKQFEPFHIRIRNFYYENEWLFLSVSQSKKFSDVRKKVIKASIKGGGKFLKPTHRFHPHITITRFKIVPKDKFPKINKKFNLNTIAVGLQDKNGQIYKIIKRFNF